jgi:DNA-binding NarL/FixJ family response regulator
MMVVLLSSDLAVLSRVDGVATRLGITLKSATREAQAVELCEANDANTVIVDLSMSTHDLASLVRQVKLSKGSKARIVAFGPHVHEQRLAVAREAGCDLVVSRGQFFSQLDAILKE